MSAATARKIIYATIAAYLVYLALVILMVVPAMNGLAPRIFKEQTGRTLLFSNITFNPFTLSITIDGAHNSNPDGSLFFAADEIIANLSLQSLWHGLTFDEVAVTGLQLNIAQTAPEQFNFSDILDYRNRHAANTPDSAASTNTLPAITVRQLHLNAQELSLKAPYLSTPIETRLHQFDLRLGKITTVVEAPVNSSATLPPLALRQLQLTLQRADIHLPRASQPFSTHLDNIQLELELFSTRDTEAQPYTVSLNDESGGNLHVTGKLSATDAYSNGELQIKQLSLLPAWRYLAPQLHLVLDRGKAALNARFDVNWKSTLRYRVNDGELKLTDVAMRARDDAESQIDLKQLELKSLQVDGSSRHLQIGDSFIDGLQIHGWNNAADVSLIAMLKTEFPPSEPAASPWQIAVANFALKNSRVDWRTNAVGETPGTDARLAIAPLTVSAKNIHWPDAAPAAVDFNATINETTSLAARGTLIPADLTGDLSGELKGLPLALGNIYVDREMTATVSGGTLNSQWHLLIDKGQPTQITAAGSVDNFQLLRKSDRSPLASWEQMRWQQLALDMPTQKLDIARVDFEKAKMRFRINADGTNNFQELIIHQAKASKEKPAAPAAGKPPAAKLWQTAVALIHLNKGELDFQDNSLWRPFLARIDDFTGDIAGLTSAPDKSARVALQGTVDGYAPVSLTGTLAPLRPQPALDIALDFTNLDLATLTNYSGTYAGYTINRGLLTLQLTYKLENKRLKGHNHIVMNQLELGEKVASTKAVDLPLRLAIALLTDENGVIDLGLDVEGELDNPQFSVRGIIWQALRNVIVKAVTSPFRLLSGLVSGGGAEEDLGLIDFEDGSDQINAAARERLGKVVQALAKRPKLQLRVIGHSDPRVDIAAMKGGVLSDRVSEAGASESDKLERNRNWRNAVTKLYEKTFPDRKVGEQTPEQLATALRDSMTLGPDALVSLAAKRALSAKRVLVVELGMPTDRVIIDSAATGDSAAAHKETANKAQVELKVDI